MRVSGDAPPAPWGSATRRTRPPWAAVSDGSTHDAPWGVTLTNGLSPCGDTKTLPSPLADSVTTSVPPATLVTLPTHPSRLAASG